MPDAKRERFLKEYSLNDKEVDILRGDKGLATYFEAVVDKGATPKIAANWILGDILRILKEKKLESKDISVSSEKLAELIKVIEDGKVSTTAGKEVLEDLFVTDDDVMDIIEKKGLMQISSSDQLENMILEVIENNPKSVEDFKAGKTQAASFLMGQVMKISKGKANPKVAKEMIDKKLSDM